MNDPYFRIGDIITFETRNPRLALTWTYLVLSVKQITDNEYTLRYFDLEREYSSQDARFNTRWRIVSRVR